MIGINISRRS